ncbi:hypothetical protein [Arthrobacter sp. JSM 101049]|uniref:hypothetical protein n=1 Tax=Arthrobacter sp. JSM 101049 TaxID=929097 RepID=UPI003563B852
MGELDVRWESLLERLRSSLFGEASLMETCLPTEVDGSFFADATVQGLGKSEPDLVLTCLGEDDLLLSFGDGTNRWELDWSEESIEMIQGVIEAVCAGRWKQYSAPGRKHLDVELADGTVVDSTGWQAPVGLIPMPGWLRRARKREQRLKDGEQHNQGVVNVLRAAAVAELGDRPYEITTGPAGVELQTHANGGEHFRIRSRGDVFELFYQDDFVHVDFVMDLEEELAVMAAEALHEVRRVCDGHASMVPAKTRVRGRPMYELTTAGGEIWRFIPA